MKARLLVAKKKYEAFEKRERMLLLGAAMASLYLLWELIFISPVQKDMKVLVARERVANQSITAAESEIMVLKKLASRDPNNQLKIELDALKLKLSALDSSLTELSNGLVSAIQLPVVLHDLLAETQDVDLLEIKTLAVSEVKLGASDYESAVESDKENTSVEGSAAADSSEAANESLIPGSEVIAQNNVEDIKVFKHGVRLKLVGSFGAIYEYLTKIEKSQWQFYWEEVDYGVTVYPNAQVELQVYTLSPERGIFNG